MATKKTASRTAATRTRSKPAASPDAPELTEEQKEIASAKSATSEAEAGGAVKVDESKIRMESEGVLTPIKSDFDNPESPVVGDPAGALVAPKDPGPVKVGPGETAAQHEAHVLTNSAERIAERIELESGPDGLPTDVIARAQFERTAKTEFQRVDGDGRIDAETVRSGTLDGTKRGGFPPTSADVPLKE